MQLNILDRSVSAALLMQFPMGDLNLIFNFEIVPFPVSGFRICAACAYYCFMLFCGFIRRLLAASLPSI